MFLYKGLLKKDRNPNWHPLKKPLKVILCEESSSKTAFFRKQKRSLHMNHIWMPQAKGFLSFFKRLFQDSYPFFEAVFKGLLAFF